jgi:hypothetical protein
MTKDTDGMTAQRWYFCTRCRGLQARDTKQTCGTCGAKTDRIIFVAKTFHDSDRVDMTVKVR